MRISLRSLFFFFNDTATTEIYTLSLHDALPISYQERTNRKPACRQSTIFLWGRPILALPLLREAFSRAPRPATRRCPPSTSRGSSTSPNPRGLSPCHR